MKKQIVKTVLFIADTPSANGVIFSLDTLNKLARTHESCYVENNQLIMVCDMTTPLQTKIVNN